MSDELRIRLAGSHADYEACVTLQRAVWGLSDLEITSTLQLVASVHAGGLVHVAERTNGEAVGFAYALPGLRDGRPHLHSDMLAVLPEMQRQGVGARLKWAQRATALERGIDRITWTFDPLQARNAHLNLRRLGAVGTEFLEDLYGHTSSELHHGLPTDRLGVTWQLQAERVRRLADLGEPSRVIPMPELPRINGVEWRAGWPVCSEPDLGLASERLLLEVPPDWDTLCRAAPRVAQDWHGKVRAALSAYFGRGYAAVDFAPTQDAGRRRPLYVLARH